MSIVEDLGKLIREVERSTFV